MTESLPDKFYITITDGEIRIQGVAEYEETNWNYETEEEDVDFYEEYFNEIVSPTEELLEVIKQKIDEEAKHDLSMGWGAVTGKPGLAEYIHEEDFKEEIEYISFYDLTIDDGSITTVFEVGLNRRHLKHSDQEILEFCGDFLIGQCSDGWGEGFEQRAFMHDDGNYHDEPGNLYFSPWTSDSIWEYYYTL